MSAICRWHLYLLTECAKGIHAFHRYGILHYDANVVRLDIAVDDVQ